MLRVWLAMLALGLAGSPAAAQPPAAGNDAAVAAFQRKANAASDVLLESRKLIIDMVERVGTIATARTEAPEKPFDPAWIAPARARAQALKLRVDGLAPMTAAELKPLYETDSVTAAEAGRLIETYPAVIGETLGAASGLVERTAELGPAAQGGDDAAALALAGAMFSGMRVAVAAETLQLELAATGYKPAHPKRALNQSSAASNKAMGEFFQMMSTQAEGQTLDLVGAARRIRGFAQVGRQAAETVPALADAMVAELQKIAGEDGVVIRARDVAAFGSFKASSANEIAISDNLSDLAVSLAEQGLSDEVEARWADVELLVERRFSLEGQRRGTLAQ